MLTMNNLIKNKNNLAIELGEDIFQLVSAITPIVNVDLLIKNKFNQTLLTWREDNFFGPGWHIPGGVIRYKELISSRIVKVAQNELKITKIKEISKLLALNEYLAVRRVRGHGISLLYECKLYELDEKKFRVYLNKDKKIKIDKRGMWHTSCPKNLIEEQRCYQKFIDSYRHKT